MSPGPLNVVAPAASSSRDAARRPAAAHSSSARPDELALALIGGGTPVALALASTLVVVSAPAERLAVALGLCVALLLTHTLVNLLADRLPPPTRVGVELARHAVSLALLAVAPSWLGAGVPSWALGLAAVATVARSTRRVELAAGLVVGYALAVIGGVVVAGGEPLAAAVTGTAVLITGALTGALIVFVLTRSAALLDAVSRMQSEADERSRAARDMQLAREDLERHIEERTIALTRANRALQREVQERRVAEEQALEASRIKSSFLANMSHELRTPLNAIIGYSEMMLEDVEDLDAGRARDDLGGIRTAATNLLEIIAGVLDLEKIEAGKLELRVETFPLAELIESLATATAPLARKHNNTLKLKHARELGNITTDRTRLHKILSNLLSNACKFTRDGRIELRVGLTVENQRPWYAFSVADTGIGIPRHMFDRLFQPFTQADESPTREYGGAGLGLSLAKHYCALLGGDLSVESTPGEGSTFTVKIPREPVDYKKDGLVLVSLY
ncbi:MAG: hypothetical protein H6713_42420 [Myxococcales bacterium]|nr:hypothetical protein [Myxococcales bacterium]